MKSLRQNSWAFCAHAGRARTVGDAHLECAHLQPAASETCLVPGALLCHQLQTPHQRNLPSMLSCSPGESAGAILVVVRAAIYRFWVVTQSDYLKIFSSDTSPISARVQSRSKRCWDAARLSAVCPTGCPQGIQAFRAGQLFAAVGNRVVAHATSETWSRQPLATSWDMLLPLLFKPSKSGH